MATKSLSPKNIFKIIFAAFWVAWIVTVLVAAATGSESWVFVPLAGFNFLFHEAGHAVGAFSGVNLLEAVCGTFFELVVVISISMWLVGKKYAFATLFAAAWLGFTFMWIGHYMADANAQELPLYSVSSFNETATDVHTTHDWQVIFSNMSLLDEAETIGRFTALLGIVIAGPLVVVGTRQLLEQYFQRKTKEY